MLLDYFGFFRDSDWFVGFPCRYFHYLHGIFYFVCFARAIRISRLISVCLGFPSIACKISASVRLFNLSPIKAVCALSYLDCGVSFCFAICYTSLFIQGGFPP